jgi:hypothetical protein
MIERLTDAGRRREKGTGSENLSPLGQRWNTPPNELPRREASLPPETENHPGFPTGSAKKSRP